MKSPSGWRKNHASNVSAPGFVTNFITDHRTGGNNRFTEERINSGEHLYALGLLKNVSSYTSTSTMDEDVRALLNDWKKNQPRLLERFDLNADGKINEKEWMLARAPVRRETLKNRREQINNFADGLNILGPTRGRSRPYILSAFTQKELARRYRLWAMLYAGGCFLLGLAVVWAFNAKFA